MVRLVAESRECHCQSVVMAGGGASPVVGRHFVVVGGDDAAAGCWFRFGWFASLQSGRQYPGNPEIIWQSLDNFFSRQ